MCPKFGVDRKSSADRQNGAYDPATDINEIAPAITMVPGGLDRSSTGCDFNCIEVPAAHFIQALAPCTVVKPASSHFVATGELRASCAGGAKSVYQGLLMSMKVDDLFLLPTWDRRIAADLTEEMQLHLADKVTTIPEMRRILAVKGFAGLRRRVESDVAGKSGPAALRAMAGALRNYALEHPGLTAATFRTATTDSPEWRQAALELAKIVCGVFAEVGLNGEPAQQALRMLRSLVRGYVLNEMTASFLEPLDYEESFKLAMDAFMLGLPAFMPPTGQSVT